MSETTPSFRERAARLVIVRMERMQRFFEWRPELAVLYLAIYSAPERKLLVKDAIGRTQLPQTSGMRAIEECVARAYLRRTPDSRDARRVYLVATPTLVDLVERYLEAELRSLAVEATILTDLRKERVETMA